MSYVSGIISRLGCTRCDGGVYSREETGEYCFKCHGSGMVDLDAEVAYAETCKRRATWMKLNGRRGKR